MQIEDDFFVQRNFDNQYKIIDPKFERTKTKKLNITEKQPSTAPADKVRKPKESEEEPTPKNTV